MRDDDSQTPPRRHLPMQQIREEERTCPVCERGRLAWVWCLEGIDTLRCSRCGEQFRHVCRHTPGGYVCGLVLVEDVPDPEHETRPHQAHEAEFWPCFAAPALEPAGMAFLRE